MPQNVSALPMAYHDQIVCGDSLAVMRGLPDGCVDLVVTSPPYNLRSGYKTNHQKRAGGLPYSDVILKGYDCHGDDLPHAEYVAWQRECLSEMVRLIPDHGAVFYNHKWRIRQGLLQDHREILGDVPLRQIIIWNKGCGMNYRQGFFLPVFEVVYLIAKPGFKLAAKANVLTDIWHIGAERNNPHPAPFPVALAQRIIGATEAQTVLDPFVGSGTTAVAAHRLGRTFMGIDNSPKYCEMAKGRIGREGA